MSNYNTGVTIFINPIVNLLTNYPMFIDKVISEYSRAERGEVPRIAFQFSMSRGHNNNNKTLEAVVTPYSTKLKSSMFKSIELEHASSRGYSYRAHLEAYLRGLDFEPLNVGIPALAFNTNIVLGLLSSGVLNFKLTSEDILSFSIGENKYKVKLDRVNLSGCNLVFIRNNEKKSFRGITYEYALQIVMSGVKGEVSKTRAIPSVYQRVVKERTSMHYNG